MPLSFTQDATGQCVPQLGLSFGSKDEGKTCWLCITHKVDDHAVETLLADLETIGWKQNKYSKAPPIDDVAETIVFKRGTGLFGNWSPEERRAYMSEVRAVLRRHGYTHVPVNRLTWQDLA